MIQNLLMCLCLGVSFSMYASDSGDAVDKSPVSSSSVKNDQHNLARENFDRIVTVYANKGLQASFKFGLLLYKDNKTAAEKKCIADAYRALKYEKMWIFRLLFGSDFAVKKLSGVQLMSGIHKHAIQDASVFVDQHLSCGTKKALVNDFECVSSVVHSRPEVVSSRFLIQKKYVIAQDTLTSPRAFMKQDAYLGENDAASCIYGIEGQVSSDAGKDVITSELIAQSNDKDRSFVRYNNNYYNKKVKKESGRFSKINSDSEGQLYQDAYNPERKSAAQKLFDDTFKI